MFLLEQGVITREQLEEGLLYQREHNQLLGQLAVDRGLLLPEGVGAICRAQQENACLFGEMALRQGRLTRQKLDEALFFQKVQHTYLGEALLLLGHITQEQYSRLLSRHYEIRDKQRISPRYLHEFFDENKILDLLVTALARALARLVSESLSVSGVGTPFAVTDFPVRALLEGRLPGDRALAAAICLSEELAARLASLSTDETTPGTAIFFTAVCRFFSDLLAGQGLSLSRAACCFDREPTAAVQDCVFVCGQTPSGQVGLVLWLAEVGS
jgi:hypothetical protein